MNRWLNKRSVTAIALIALAATLWALPAIGNDSETEHITLASIEADILSDNVAVGRAELAVELQEEELRQAKNEKIKISGAGLEQDMKKRYYVRQAEMNLYIAEKDLEDVKQSEVTSGTKMYFDYMLLVKEIALQNSQILRLTDELAAVDKKIELGRATLKDRTVKELERTSAEFDLSTLQAEKETLFLDINRILQQDLSTILVIESISVPFEKFVTENLDQDIETVLETNQGIWRLEKQHDLDEIELDILDKFNGSDLYDDAIDSLEDTLKQNVLDIADKRLSLEYDVRSKYNGVLNKHDAVAIKVLELENLQLTLDILTKRYEVGFETQNTLDAAAENVAAAELALLQAKLDYFVEVEGYKDYIN